MFENKGAIMNDNTTLATIGRLINTNSGGKPSELGCEANALEAQIELANSLNHKPIRVLKNWKRFRIDTDERKEQILRQLQPSICKSGIYIVYSDMVVSDSTGRVPSGGWVRSTFLESLSAGCIFETQNTNYILLGDGRDEVISLTELYALYQMF